MPRTKKTKSSQLAKAIELIESGVKELRAFNDNIDPLLLDSEMLKLIKPLIDNLAKAVTPEPAPDAPGPDNPPAHSPDETPAPGPDTFSLCEKCKFVPDSAECNPVGITLDENSIVTSCPGFALPPENEQPDELSPPGANATLVHKIPKSRKKDKQ